MVAFLDVLLGVVPGAAARTHRDGNKKPGDDGAHQQAAQRGRAEEVTNQHRDDDRQQRGHDHFADGRLGQQIHGLVVLRLAGAFHDAGNFAELAADFLHHRARCATHGLHGERTEQVGDHAADQQADNHFRLVDREVDHADAELLVELVRVVGEQHQRGQAGRTDRITLGHGLGGVAHGVQCVGDLADLRTEVAHFRNATGVVGNRTVGIQCHDHAGHRQHGSRGDRNAVQAGDLVATVNGRSHRQHRGGSRLHRHGQAGDDVGAVAGFRRLRHLLHRAVFGRGVVLGDDDQRGGQCQADHGAPEQGHADVGREHFPGHEVERASSQDARDDQAAIKRIHDLAAFANAHEEGADDGRDDGHRTQHQRIDRACPAVGPVSDACNQHRSDDGDGVGFEKIRGHAGAVADVVADVVGDDGRVAWVILGNTGFDLAHQIGAHVSALGEDAAAQAREDRDQ